MTTTIDFSTDTWRQELQVLRHERVRRIMRDLNVSALLILDPVNIQYATGARNMTVFSIRTPARFHRRTSGAGLFLNRRRSGIGNGATTQTSDRSRCDARIDAPGYHRCGTYANTPATGSRRSVSNYRIGRRVHESSSRIRQQTNATNGVTYRATSSLDLMNRRASNESIKPG